MIKILKEGTIKHQKKCNKCDCVFEFSAEDVTHVTMWDDHGGPHAVAGFLEIKCPFCKKAVDLERKEFTETEQINFKEVDR